MKSASTIQRTLDLWADGWSKAAIAREVQVSRATVREWIRSGEDLFTRRSRRGECRARCQLRASLPGEAYAYLLGQYLGDGWIDMKGRRGVHIGPKS